MALEHFCQSAISFLRSKTNLSKRLPELQKNKPSFSLNKQEVAEARLERLIEYLLAVVLYENKQDQYTIIQHLLASIAEEENLKFSHLLYAVNESRDQAGRSTAPSLTIRDWQNPRFIVEKICKQSLQQAVNSQEARRYQLELSQWLQFKQKLFEFMPQQANALLQTIISESAAKQEELLQKQGFKPASSKQLSEILLNFPHLAQHRLCCGQRLGYLMPPSEIHPGGLSVVVINQPLFDLDNGRLFLHQTQLLVELNCDQLLTLAAQLGMPPIPTDYSEQMKEAHLLNNILSIPQQLDSLSNSEVIHFDSLSNSEVIHSLLEQFKFDGRGSLEPIDPNLIQQYAQLLLDIVGSEAKKLDINRRQQTKTYDRAGIKAALEPQAQARLAQFFYSIIFKGLKTPNFLPNQDLIQQVKQFFQSWGAKNQSSHSDFETQAVQQIGFWPAAQKVTSLSQCAALSPANIMQQLNNKLSPKTMSRLTQRQLTHQQLNSLIGEKRAKLWRRGRCQNCGQTTLIGECGWCYACELDHEPKAGFTQSNLSSTQLNFTEQNQQSPSQAACLNLPSISLNQFINGEDTRMVNQALNNF